LKVGHFSSDAEVIAAAETWLDGQISDFFFFEWLEKLEQLAKKCIELRWENAEKIPSLVAVACILPGRSKVLSSPPRIQSTLRNAHDICKNISLTLLFGSDGDSYKISTQSDMCKYTHVLQNIDSLGGQKK